MVKKELCKLVIDFIEENKNWVIEGDASDDATMSKTRKILHEMGYNWASNGYGDNNDLSKERASRNRVWYMVYLNKDYERKQMRCVSNITCSSIDETNKKEFLFTVWNSINKREVLIIKSEDFIKKYG